jgi:hypothetical protein
MRRKVWQQEGDNKMDENKKITMGGIIFLLLVAIMGMAWALCGAWVVLYPPPNPQDFMSNVGNVFMIGSGSALATMALMTLLIKSRK